MLSFLLLLLTAAALQDGLVAMRAGQYAEAKQKLEQAVQAEPKNAIAWISLAETCRRTNDKSEAADAAGKAADFGGDQPPVQHALAMFYAAQGRFRDAGQWEEKYAPDAKDEAQTMTRAAGFYEQAGAKAEAERAYKAAWTRQSADPEIAFPYVKLLLEKLDFAGAIAALKPARTAHPKDPQLLLVSGVANYGERRFPEAVSDFLSVIAIDPTIPQPYQFLSRMLEHAKDRLPEVTAAFTKRVRQAPGDPLPYLALAKAKMEASSSDLEAEPLLRQSLALDAANWDTHYQLGVLLEARHKFADAAAELKQAIALDRKQAMPHYHLARVYDRLGNSVEAQAERKIHQDLTGDQELTGDAQN